MSRYIDADLVKPAMENSDDSLLNQPMTIRHVESLLDDLPTVQTVSPDRIKAAREELHEASHADADGWNTVIDLEDAFEILDKLIAEVER